MTLYERLLMHKATSAEEDDVREALGEAANALMDQARALATQRGRIEQLEGKVANLIEHNAELEQKLGGR